MGVCCMCVFMCVCGQEKRGKECRCVSLPFNKRNEKTTSKQKNTKNKKQKPRHSAFCTICALFGLYMLHVFDTK